MMTSLNAAVEKRTQCSASKMLVLAGGVSPGKPGAEKYQCNQSGCVYESLLGFAVSGGLWTSARSRVNHLVLPAWSSVLQWPVDFSMFKTAFLPSYHSTLDIE